MNYVNADRIAARRLASRIERLGITRIADTTGFDRIGIPTASCVRPGTSDSIWVYSGKGTSFDSAYVGAVMECVERTSSLWDADRVVFATETELESKHCVWGPKCFTERKRREVSKDSMLAWVLAKNLIGGGSVFVPAELAFNGAAPSNVEPLFEVSTTNGLAAGFSREAAIVHGILEIVERDVVSHSEFLAGDFSKSLLAHMAKMLGMSLEPAQGDSSIGLRITKSTLPPRLRYLVAKFERAGLRIELSFIPNRFQIPVCAAAAVEEMGRSGFLAAAGYGASLQLEHALEAAILELAQSRSTDRQGARDDCGEGTKARLKDPASHHWLLMSTAESVPYASLPQFYEKHDASLSVYLDRLEMNGLWRVAVVDFPRVENLYPVRVLIPETNTWHITGGLSRVSRSSMELLRIRYGNGILQTS